MVWMLNTITVLTFCEEVEFVPLSVRDVSPPFSPGVIPAAVAVVDLCQVPLWMFADMSWNMYATLPYIG